MTTLINEKNSANRLALVTSFQGFSKNFYCTFLFIPEEDIQIIVQHWVRVLNIKLGWINDFNKLVFNYSKYFRLLKVLKGHKSGINSVRLSANGCKVISSSNDNTVRIWNVASGKQIQIFEGHTNWTRVAEFSPDEQVVISGSADETIRLWDAESGKQMIQLEGHSNWIWGISISSDGKNIVSCSTDETIRLWSVNSEKEIKTFAGHSAGVLSVQFSLDNQMIVSASVDTTIALWDVKSGKRLKELTGHSNAVIYVKFSPDDKFIVSCSDDKTIRIWDVKSGKETVVSCSNDMTVRLWDVKSGLELQRLEGHSDRVRGIDVSLDSSQIKKFYSKNTSQNITAIWKKLLYFKKLVQMLFFIGKIGSFQCCILYCEFIDIKNESEIFYEGNQVIVESEFENNEEIIQFIAERIHDTNSIQ
ncbi:hypothetical protein RFI_28600 [Reticulomyxa filosa]|uniref:G-protein beta WD-40 repeats containing protein n=1 Tax=Reticulomyxa filosa TaxID=46433 RepID=X6M582_RETFI|nr:hypothetical protein RFI_28600 [Reticulomyxa filosa]|eukprot:ETO08786.1 hypothetical protein RFI_28600 [Reticulomyxa filosa]